MLERLAAPAAPAQEPARASAPAETVDKARLEALAHPTEPAAAAPAAPVAPEKAAELEKANEKLASLLGKTKN